MYAVHPLQGSITPAFCRENLKYTNPCHVYISIIHQPITVVSEYIMKLMFCTTPYIPKYFFIVYLFLHSDGPMKDTAEHKFEMSLYNFYLVTEILKLQNCMKIVNGVRWDGVIVTLKNQRHWKQKWTKKVVLNCILYQITENTNSLQIWEYWLDWSAHEEKDWIWSPILRL